MDAEPIRDPRGDESAGGAESSSAPSRRTECALLVAIVAAGAALRFSGAAFGLPRKELFDEPNVFRAAVAIARGGGLDPHFYEYGTVFLYALAAVFAPIARLAGWTLELADGSGTMGPRTELLWWLGRSLSALAGSLTIVLCSFAARRMWGRAAGLGAAALVAFSLLHVHQSQILKPDATAAAFVALCLWAACRGLAGDGDGWFAASGLAAGLAAATKYNAGIAIALPVFCEIARRRRAPAPRIRTLATVAISALASFLVAMIWTLPRWQPIVASVARQMAHYTDPAMAPAPCRQTGRFFLAYLWRSGLGPAPSALVLVGAAALAVREPRRALAVFPFALLYFALLARTTIRPVQNLLALLPVAALAAGYATHLFAGWLATRPWPSRARAALAVAAFVAVFAWPIARIVVFDRVQRAPSTRRAATGWIASRTSPDTPLCIEPFGLPPSGYADPRVTTLPPGWWRDPARFLRPGCMVVTNSFFASSFTCGDVRGGDEGRSIEGEIARWPLLAEFRGPASRSLASSLVRELNAHAPMIEIRRYPGWVADGAGEPQLAAGDGR